MDSLDSASGLVALVAALAAAGVLGLWLRRSGRRLGRATPGRVEQHPAEQVVLGPDDLGAPLGERATLVQFSTAFCQPCRATRRVLADVSATVPGVAHVEVDAESQLELVRRASGQPRPADVIAALGVAVGDT